MVTLLLNCPIAGDRTNCDRKAIGQIAIDSCDRQLPRTGVQFLLESVLPLKMVSVYFPAIV